MQVQSQTILGIVGPDYLDALIDEHIASNFLGYSARALRNWRHRGGGPPFIRVNGRSVRYRRRDLIAWASSRLIAR